MKLKQRQISRWAVGVRRYTMYVSMLSAVMLAACNTDEATEGGILLPEGEYPLTFTASGLTMPIATRSTSDGTWEGGEVVAIRVTGKDDTKEVKEYTASVVEGTDKKTATLTSEAPYYWQSSEETKNVDAWYCGTGYSLAQPTEWSVQAGQNQEGNYQKSDFLYAAATQITYGGDKNLSFRHQTAKVVINILNKEAVSDAGQISAIELQNTVLTGTFTVDEEGKLEAKKEENVGSITPRRLTTTSGETILASYEALVIPQTVEADKPLIAITIDDDRYIYKPQTAATFKARSVHTYDITVKANGLYVETVTGGEWDQDGTNNELVTSWKAYEADDLKIGDYFYRDKNDNWVTSDGGLRKIYSDGRMEWATDKPDPDNEKGTCIGIVFSTDPSRVDEDAISELTNKDHDFHGLVVALTNAADNSCNWGNNNMDETGDPFTENTGNPKKMWNNVNGYKETQYIIKTYGPSSNNTLENTYPAFYHTMNYGTEEEYKAPQNTTGWFLPSIGQWWTLLETLGGLGNNETLKEEKKNENGGVFVNNISSTVVTNLNACLPPNSVPEFEKGAIYWSSSEHSQEFACVVTLGSNDNLSLHKGRKQTAGPKVRCILAF